VVYADWKRNSDANPVAFSSLTISLLRQFKASQVITARKFLKGTVSVDDWERLVLERKSENQDSSQTPASKRQRTNLISFDIS
jgi:hypothetical protein